MTFDDGPHPDHTPHLLDVLGDLKIRATFFLTGQAVAAETPVVRRMAAEGHEIGHHSYTHEAPETTSSRELAKEIDRTVELLRSLGVTPRLFRPPHGKVTIAKALCIWSRAQTIVLWNVDPKDFACVSAEQLSRRFEQRPIRSGDIVLLHDTYPHAARVLPEVAKRVRDAGLEFATVSESCFPRQVSDSARTEVGVARA